jgi:hypothetical protein
MRLQDSGWAILGCLALLNGPVPAAEVAGQGAPPDPNQIVQRMCDYLKSLDRFSFRAEVTDDQVYTGGKKLQFGFTTETFVVRPDKLRVNAAGDLFDKQFLFNGETLTLFDVSQKVYATEAVSGDIEAALAKADGQLRLRVPLADLTSPRLCEHMVKDQGHALYVGPSKVGGVATDHLAFDRADMQYQLWVKTGDRPLPVKILVNQKTLPAAPQWTAMLSDWKTGPKLKPDLFTFKAPPGVKQIRFAAVPDASLTSGKPLPPPPPPEAPPVTQAVTPVVTPAVTGEKP